MMWSPKLFYESLYVAYFWNKKAVKYVHICLDTCFNIDQRLFQYSKNIWLNMKPKYNQFYT